MFLKRNRRKKNGRTFTYYSIVENRRCAGGRTVQRQVLYLGELNGSQLEAWRKSIAVFDEEADAQTELALYPESGAPADLDPTAAVEIRLGELHRPRQWGACWIALHFWDVLGLDGFFGPRLGRSRKGTDWLAVLKTLVCYRLIDPGSEWRDEIARRQAVSLRSAGASPPRKCSRKCERAILRCAISWALPKAD